MPTFAATSVPGRRARADTIEALAGTRGLRDKPDITAALEASR